jgi:hypothetical protein
MVEGDDDEKKKPSPTSYRNMPNVRDENVIKIKYMEDCPA